MAKTITVDFTGTASYAKLQESSRDMGSNLMAGSDQRIKLEECEGMYVMNVFIDAATKKKMIADGVPNKGMTGQLFKEDDDGNLFYKCTRKHINPKFEGASRLMGPPKVIKDDGEGANVGWDWEEDGLIGNDSEVKVRLSVWDGKIVTMEIVKVLELIPYEGSTGGPVSSEGM